MTQKNVLEKRFKNTKLNFWFGQYCGHLNFEVSLTIPSLGIIAESSYKKILPVHIFLLRRKNPLSHKIRCWFS